MLEADVDPWAIQWETDDVVLTCTHDVWESVLLTAEPEVRRLEEVVRCRACHAPRCGHARDKDPCVLVRHHKDKHLRATRGFGHGS